MPSDARRAQILQAAAELFAERGFAGTTTREIAAAVGASETVLFRLFPTKESLYLAVLEHQVPSAEVEQWLRQLREIAETRDDEALFRAVVTAVLASYRAYPVYHRLMLFAALEHQELARVWQVTYTAPVTSFLREYVSRRQAEGAFHGGASRTRGAHAGQHGEPLRAVERARSQSARAHRAGDWRAGGRPVERAARGPLTGTTGTGRIDVS